MKRRETTVSYSQSYSHTRDRSVTGMSYVEVLVASLIGMLCLSVMIQLWLVLFSVSARGNDLAVGYNLERQTLEQVIEMGWTNTPEAPVASPTVHYYGINGDNEDATSASARFKVSTSVVSTPAQPSSTALRLVTVSVTQQVTSTVICSTHYYLTQGGL